MKRLLIALILGAMLISDNIHEIITNECRLYPAIGPEIITAITWRESRYGKFMYNSNSINQCFGVMQISDKLLDWVNYRGPVYYTEWEELDIDDLYDTFINIRLGVWYYSYCLRVSEYNTTNALHKYNLGHNTKRKNWSYVNDVLKKYDELQ